MTYLLTRSIKNFFVFFIFFNLILFKNVYPSSFDSLTIPANIQIKLSNKDYNNYLRKGMRAFADSEIDGKGNIKKKIQKMG